MNESRLTEENPRNPEQSPFLDAMMTTLPEEHAGIFNKLAAAGLLQSSPMDEWDVDKIWNLINAGSGLEWGIVTLIIMYAATTYSMEDWRHSTVLGVNMNTIFSTCVAVGVGGVRWASHHPSEAQKYMSYANQIVAQIVEMTQ